MKSNPLKQLLFTCFVIIFCFLSPSKSHAEIENAVSKRVDAIQIALQTGKKPEELFPMTFSEVPDNEARAKLLDPYKWIPNAPEAGHYIGTFAFIRITAPYDQVLKAANAYDDEAKFTPGIVSAKVVERKKISEKEEVLKVEREREVPVALKAVVPGSNSYRNINHLIKLKSSMIVRIKLDSEKGGYLKDLEALEYYVKLPDGKTAVYLVGFALPSASFLASKPEEKQESGNKLIGVFDKVVSAIDPREKLYMEIAKAIVDGTYQTATSLMQVTTKKKWKNKDVTKFSKDDREDLLDDNEDILKKAKKRNLIDYNFN